MSDKISKEKASYQDHAEGAKHCSGCTMFIRQFYACTYVRGAILPDGYCKFYEPKK